MRCKLEEERRALAAFVTKFDALGLGLGGGKVNPPMPMPGGASAAFAEKQRERQGAGGKTGVVEENENSPVRMEVGLRGPSLLEQMPEEEWSDISFEIEMERMGVGMGKGGKGGGRGGREREVLGGKENLPVRG